MTELRRLRIATGMSCADFAAFAGVNPETMGSWELGRYRPRPEARRRVCRCLSKLLGRRVRPEEVWDG